MNYNFVVNDYNNKLILWVSYKIFYLYRFNDNILLLKCKCIVISSIICDSY